MRGVTEQIVVASTPAEYEQFAALIREYWQWLQARYADRPGFVDSVAGHQALDEELARLSEAYGPPEGLTLLAVRDGEVTGAVACRDLHDGSCEMKRLYVPDRFRGQGTGRLLCEALVDRATSAGFRLMRLDTGELNAEATAMYLDLGFTECAPFHQYPASLMPHLRFMERPLGGGPADPEP